MEECKIKKALELLSDVVDNQDKELAENAEISETYDLLKRATLELKERESEVETLQTDLKDYNDLKENFSYMTALIGEKDTADYLSFIKGSVSESPNGEVKELVEKWKLKGQEKTEAVKETEDEVVEAKEEPVAVVDAEVSEEAEVVAEPVAEAPIPADKELKENSEEKVDVQKEDKTDVKPEKKEESAKVEPTESKPAAEDKKDDIKLRKSVVKDSSETDDKPKYVRDMNMIYRWEK